MLTAVKTAPKNLADVPLQPVSLDIWDKKYRLKDKRGEPVDQHIDDTFQRVARALADTESTPDLRKHWYERFLWALRRGAIPAGRITSNAGALEHKPATSTINCTVSGIVEDSMNGILEKVHEAGLTLKAGCGIGYEFSTLRPKGAFVAGAGAYTSGPLSFMDIYDKMCFTVSSAGGRRGAQMATFDIAHPDVADFIKAKREAGRLRQFNLSCLITREFMEAVKNDQDWSLAFPVSRSEAENTALLQSSDIVWREWPNADKQIRRDDGKVACRIYKTMKARRLWDVIMSSTYDFAEPGFILIDRVNEMNNNWWCENIRATNPCVTADTRLATQYGMVRIGDLYDARVDIQATVDRRALGEAAGVTVRPAVPAFMTAPSADVYRVVTEAGYEIKATEWHDFYTTRGKIKLKDLKPDDELLIQSGKGQFGGCGSEELGVLVGLLTGDGYFTDRGQGNQAAVVNLRGGDRACTAALASWINTMIAGWTAQPRGYSVRPVAIPQRNLIMFRSVMLARYLTEIHGISRSCKTAVPEVIWRGNEACVKGYLRGLFRADGAVDVSDNAGTSCSVRLNSSEPSLLKDVQVLLANFGIFSRLLRRREADERMLADGNGGRRACARKADYELIVDGQSRERFMAEIGFLTDAKNGKHHAWAVDRAMSATQAFVSRIAEIRHLGREAVFDTTQPDSNTVIFNGIVTGQCGEQPLPPYGSCLLGSVNLTRFVREPFTARARFDWDE